VYLIVVTESDVYAAGFISSGSDVGGYWKNGVWTGLPQIDTTKNSWVHSIAVSGGDIYAAGYSSNSSSTRISGYWKNGTWTELTRLSSGQDSEVNSIVIDVQ